ncbi:MAG: FAD-dependent oxidoreductase [Trueperaceae bacterium]
MRTFPGREHLYDIAIVGAGIAGSEAAMTAAREGRDVLLVTTSLDTVYMLAHARAALEPQPGTLMAELVAALAPTGKPVERWELHRAAKYALEAQSGIHLLQSNVTELSEARGRVTGVLTWEGVGRRARLTALCVGSFLGARLEQGSLREVAGRLGEMAYDELFDDLRERGVSFDSATLDMSEAAEGPPYRVMFRSISRGEQTGGGYDLTRFGGLYAAGACAGGPQTYEQSAVDGRSLGAALSAVTAGENGA